MPVFVQWLRMVGPQGLLQEDRADRGAWRQMPQWVGGGVLVLIERLVEGMTLTGAAHLILTEPSYSPLTEAQKEAQKEERKSCKMRACQTPGQEKAQKEAQKEERHRYKAQQVVQREATRREEAELNRQWL